MTCSGIGSAVCPRAAPLNSKHASIPRLAILMAFSFFLVNGALPGAPISRQNRVDQITSDNPYKPNKSNGLFGGNIQVGKEATLTAMTALRERRRTQVGQHRFLIRCPSYRQNGCVQQ